MVFVLYNVESVCFVFPGQDLRDEQDYFFKKKGLNLVYPVNPVQEKQSNIKSITPAYIGHVSIVMFVAPSPIIAYAGSSANS